MVRETHAQWAIGDGSMGSWGGGGGGGGGGTAYDCHAHYSHHMITLQTKKL